MSFFDDFVLPAGAGFGLAEVGRLVSKDGPTAKPDLERFSVPYFGVLAVGAVGVSVARGISRDRPFLAFAFGAGAVGTALIAAKLA